MSYCLLSKKKEYLATIKLGTKTDTLDITGKIMEEKKVGNISRKRLNDIIESMKGEYMQKIPAYSAKKIKGKHLYDYARAGIEIEEIKNNVSIYDMKLISFNKEEFCLKIFCSAGTYIRAIAGDIGERLGCGAVLSQLERLKIGLYDIKDSVRPEEFVSLKKNENADFNHAQLPKGRFLVPVEMLSERKKTIYFYKKYINMLEMNSPLYGYMINLHKTNKKIINENDVLSVKLPGSKKYYIHKAITDFDTCNIEKRNEKLTKYISAVFPQLTGEL